MELINQYNIINDITKLTNVTYITLHRIAQQAI